MQIKSIKKSFESLERIYPIDAHSIILEIEDSLKGELPSCSVPECVPLESYLVFILLLRFPSIFSNENCFIINKIIIVTLFQHYLKVVSAIAHIIPKLLNNI